MMSKRLRFYLLVLFATICIFILALNQRYSYYAYDQRSQAVFFETGLNSWNKYEDRLPDVTSKIDESSDDYIKNSLNFKRSILMEIDEVIEEQRRILSTDLEEDADYDEKFSNYKSKFDKLIPEKGGNPIRSIVLSTWRSGSTFVGDILNSHPANFYHYEPLLHYGIIQIRDPPLTDEATQDLESMFTCDYKNLDHYLRFGKNQHPWVFNHNTHLWRQCQLHKEICWDHRFVSKFCKLFPYQSMKMVRLRLGAMERFLEQNNLGLKILLLIRDPRGVLQSRKHREWCPSEPDCFEPAKLCADMVLDYRAAVKFAKRFPENFRVVRYEDLSLEPYDFVQSLFKFFGLDYHYSVKEFLDTHTKTDIGGLSSTFRNSKTAPFHWRQDLDFEEVSNIQKSCKDALRLWGYNLAYNSTHQKSFNPVANYAFNGSTSGL